MIAIGHPWTSDGQRQVFRTVLESWSRPGQVSDLGAWIGSSRASLAALAALCDAATTLADPDALLTDGDRSRLGARAAVASEAAFVIADAHRAPAVAPTRGSLLAPELGATLILECQAVGEGPALRLTGPGIERCCELRALGIDPHWWPARAGWCAPPQGVDLILCDARRIACIPRSIAVEV